MKAPDEWFPDIYIFCRCDVMWRHNDAKTVFSSKRPNFPRSRKNLVVAQNWLVGSLWVPHRTCVPIHQLHDRIGFESISSLERAVGPKRPFLMKSEPIRPTGSNLVYFGRSCHQDVTHKILERLDEVWPRYCYLAKSEICWSLCLSFFVCYLAKSEICWSVGLYYVCLFVFL